MKSRAPIQDSIDIRNYHDELKSRIVKRSRVRYIVDEKDLPMDEETLEAQLNNQLAGETQGESTSAEAGVDVSGVEADVLAEADAIFKRLQAEAEADEKAKEAEWIEKLTADNGNSEVEIDESMYNATTGSYSGAYGKGEISDATKEQAANILGKKDDDFIAMLLAQTENS